MKNTQKEERYNSLLFKLPLKFKEKEFHLKYLQSDRTIYELHLVNRKEKRYKLFEIDLLGYQEGRISYKRDIGITITYNTIFHYITRNVYKIHSTLAEAISKINTE